jgi:predicted anti-sigma-YlaC factor YlaD
LLVQGHRAREIQARAREHLRHCPDCRKHHERRLDALVARFSAREENDV